MPGLSNLNNLFKTMSKGNMPNPMKQQFAKSSMQEKLRKKLEKRQQEQEENNNNSQETLEKVWKPDEESEPMEKSLRSNKPKNKKKKKKKAAKKDACYYKVKARYSVWPSAYASGALVKCQRRLTKVKRGS